ncbi:hypothetical protein ABZ639_17965 [Saccharomonospora sp. NPDC006951]
MSGDGTQAPEPPLAFTDPVAGSSGNGRSDYGVRSGAGRDDDTGQFQVAAPVAPDPEMVRSMVDAALGEDRPRDPGEDPVSVDRAAAAVEAGEAVEAPEPPPETAAETTGQLPAVPAGIPQSPGIYPQPHKAWSDRASWLPQVMRLRGKRAKDGEGDGEEEDVVERPPSRPVLRKPTSGSAGLAVALVLLAVFVLLAIQFVASFVESVTGLFN